MGLKRSACLKNKGGWRRLDLLKREKYKTMYIQGNWIMVSF